MQQLCKIMPHYDNFWHKVAHQNVPVRFVSLMIVCLCRSGVSHITVGWPSHSCSPPASSGSCLRSSCAVYDSRRSSSSMPSVCWYCSISMVLTWTTTSCRRVCPVVSTGWTRSASLSTTIPSFRSVSRYQPIHSCSSTYSSSQLCQRQWQWCLFHTRD